MARTKVAKNLLDSQSVFAEVKNGSKRSFVKDSNANSEITEHSIATRKPTLNNPTIYSTETVESKLRKLQISLNENSENN